MEKIKKYKSIFAFATVTFLAASFNNKLPVLIGFLNNLGTIAFIGGLFYSYSITAPISLLFLSVLEGNLIALALLAASGSVIADYVIFRFLKDKLLFELEAFMRDEVRFDVGSYMRNIYNVLQRSKVGRFIIVPTIASLVIASPLPDEVGIAMFASLKLDDRIFVIISLTLNFLGIAAILGMLRLII